MQQPSSKGDGSPSRLLRRSLHRMVALILAAILTHLSVSSANSEETPNNDSAPNVVLILADDK